jgi:glycerophosphoryl diester phosphodiesterase
MFRKRRWLIVSLLTLFILSISFGTVMPGAEAKDSFLNIAHRGASGHAPENTMAAFDKAVEMKADFFELDVQMSKDGHLVIMHDVTVDRTTDGTGRVGDLTLEELKKLDAGSWFGPEFAGERIPTLGEVLDRYRGKIGILIEIKNPELYPGIEEKVAKALKKRNMHRPKNGKVIVQSFGHESMKKFHRLLPSVPVGVLLSHADYQDGVSDEDLAAFSRYADYVNPSQSLVDEDLVRRVHGLGMKITPYTIRTKEEAERMIALGVDGIVTDFPELGHLK